MDSFALNLDDGNTLEVYRFIYEPVKSNMYIIIQNDEAVVIDPNVSDEAFALLSEHSVTNIYILLTHEHYDHTSGIVWFTEHFNCTIILSDVCAGIVKSKRNNNPMLIAFVLADQDRQDGGNRYQKFKEKFVPYSINADKLISNNENICLLGHKFTFRYTPGHSPASLCIELDDIAIWTGDSLIRDTQTITRFRESNKSDYENIALPYLKSIKKNTTIFPGHFDPFKIQDINFDDIRF